MPLPVLRLQSKQTHRCLSGHPWVFRSELDPAEYRDLEAGAEVQVTERGRAVGRGFWSPSSQIAVRLLSRCDQALDEAFLRERLRSAVARRARDLPRREACRLVSSEGDGLPGLILDRYRDRLAIQFTSAGMEVRRELWQRLIVEELRPFQLVERDDLPVRTLEGLPQRSGVLLGPADTRLDLRIGRIEAEVDLLDPHKTGSYLDQQFNHEAVADRVRPGMRVLDACCHLGGFALHALLAGAAEAIGVDQSAASLALARNAAERNRLADRFRTEEADIFPWFAAAARRRERFDLVVLDPPSFTRNRAGVAQALKGYGELHRRALSLLQPGGLLATFTCSHHIGRDEFLANAAEAAARHGRSLRLAAHLHQACDHPIIPGLPESEYLKGAVLELCG